MESTIIPPCPKCCPPKTCRQRNPPFSPTSLAAPTCPAKALWRRRKPCECGSTTPSLHHSTRPRLHFSSQSPLTKIRTYGCIICVRHVAIRPAPPPGGCARRRRGGRPELPGQPILPSFTFPAAPKCLFLQCNSAESCNSDKVLTAKNAKNTETRTYVAFSLRSLHCCLSISLIFARILPWVAAGFLTQSRKGAKAQRAFSGLATLQCYPQELRIFGKVFRTVLPKDK